MDTKPVLAYRVKSRRRKSRVKSRKGTPYIFKQDLLLHLKDYIYVNKKCLIQLIV